MNPISAAFLDRLRATATGVRDLSHIPEWIMKNTSHPKNSDLPWTFADHEMQVGILGDNARHLIVRKCSQVGLSETVVRMVLAMMAILPESHIIYTLQTAKFASDFARTRIDPVVAGSQMLKNIVSRQVDNTGLKKIGSSFLYISGASGQGQAISVPADVVVNDEEDFSDPTTLSTYASRLGHATDGGIRRRFSTPTVDGYGVSKEFPDSTQHHYTCKCRHCGTRQVLDFFTHVKVPGFNDHLSEFRREDLTNPAYNVSGAAYLCENCGKELDLENLNDPSMREWVAAFPDRDIHGYQVGPHDVPKTNSAAVTLRSVGEYARYADFVNFKVGNTYEDSTTSVTPTAVYDNATLQWLKPIEGAKVGTGFCIGVDQGKTSWLLVGKMVGTELHIVHAERIKVTHADSVPAALKERADQYGVVRLCTDAAPDYTTAMRLRQDCPDGVAWGVYYNKAAKVKYSNLTLNEEEQIVTAYRTGAITEMVRDVNSGKIKFAPFPELPTINEHLRSLKRVSTINDDGTREDKWIATKPADHFAHALNYLRMAIELAGISALTVPVRPLTILTARLGQPTTKIARQQ